MRRRITMLTLLLTLLAAVAACGGDGGSVEAFCETARGFGTDNPAAALADVDPVDRAGTASQVREQGDRLRDWADEAPAEIENDVEDLSDAAATLAEALAEPSAPDQAETTALAEELSGVGAASERVLAFTSAECGVDLETPANVGSLSGS